LDRSCGFTTREISAAIERLLQIDVLIIENEQEIFNAVSVLKTGKARFADVVIAELGRRAGCRRTLTFDHTAARLADCELV
jgi:predicted nucleic-acid-binding protein